MTESAKGSVLLVDDDKFLAEMYSTKFSASGYQIHTSLSVEDALETLRGGYKPDVILFDLLMPERDGFAFLEVLSREHLAPGAVRIALTNQGNDAEKEKAEKMGADRCLMKASMIPSEVVTVVGEEIAKKKKPVSS